MTKEDHASFIESQVYKHAKETVSREERKEIRKAFVGLCGLVVVLVVLFSVV